MFTLRKKDKQVNNSTGKVQSYLAIDIGTEYVKTVVYTIQKREVEVIGYSRTKQKESSMYAAFIINIKDVVDVIDRSIGEAVTIAKETAGDTFIIPKDAIIGIAGELVQGVTVMVNADRDKPDTVINEKEVETLISRVKKHTFDNTKEEIAKEIGLKPTQVEEVNTYINSVYIDGVRVTNPVGYKGDELVYRVFSTFAPKIHISTVEQVAKELGLNVKHLIVEPYALTLGLKNIRNSDANAIIIDIGGGTTDVALVQNGDIIGTKMFAIGGRVFTKRVQKEFNLNYQDADKMKVDYSNNKLNSHDASVLTKAFDKDIKTWLTGVEISLEEFEDVSEYPSEIFLCGGGALLPQIQEGLMTHPWLQVLNFKKYPKVNFAFPTNIRDVLDKTKKANMPMDVTPLALARMSLEI